MTGGGGPLRTRAVVVTWNGAHLLPACLDSLRAQTVADRLEVVVVDNASQDGTADLVRDRYPGVRLVANPANLGFAGGVVAGTRDLAADAVLLLNNDATLDPDALERMSAALTAPGRERVGAVTAKILLEGWFVPAPADGAPLPPGAFRRGDVVLRPAGPHDPGAVRVVNSTGNVVTRTGAGTDRDWLAVDGTESTDPDVMGFSGGAALLRRAALEEIGGFDADLFLYYEDTDVSWRLRAAGWSVRYEATAVARHRHAASSDSASPLFRYYNTRNSLVVVGRHAPLRVVAVSAARQTAGALLARLRGTEPRAVADARLRGLWHAVLRAPRTAAERRRMWRRAAVPRGEVARYLA